MLETIAYVVFFALAIATLLLKNWAISRWPRADDEGAETDVDARRDTDSERDR